MADEDMTVEQIREAREKLALEKKRKAELAALEAEAEEEQEIEVIQQEKQKLIMDFNTAKRRPERVNIEVLRDMILDNPERMSDAARRWLDPEEPPV